MVHFVLSSKWFYERLVIATFLLWSWEIADMLRTIVPNDVYRHGCAYEIRLANCIEQEDSRLFVLGWRV